MDPKSQETLDGIVKKTPESLNPDEVRFLRARRGYLNKAQLEEFDSVINPPAPKAEEPEQEEVPVEKPKKKGK